MNVALGCCAKMEENYIIEWIQHYKKLGFSHIFIADNNADDYEYPLIPIIQSYIDEGFVTVYDYHNAIQPMQQKAYSDIYNIAKKEYDWIAFFDIDEFLEINNAKDIKEFVNIYDKLGFNVINIIWQVYISENQFFYEQEDVQKRFTKWKFSKTIKSIVKCIPENTKIESVHDPLNHNYNKIQWNRCDVLGNPRKRSKHGPDLTNDKKIDISYILKCYKIAYIKHYQFKSLEEWILYKYKRGRCDNIKKGALSRLSLKTFFREIKNKKMEKHKYTKQLLKKYNVQI